MEFEGDDKKPSFGYYDIGGEKLRLIDITKEEDFLIASSLFDTLDDLRLSVSFDDANVREAFKSSGPQTSVKFENTGQQKEQNLSPSEALEPARPSYLRRSLAWDSAFFNSAGVLDPDELSFINRGFKAVDPMQQLPPRTCEEIRLQRFEPVSSINVSRKVDIDAQNKIKTKLVSKRQSINTQRSKKTKIETPRRENSHLSSLRPPKASGSRIKNLLRGQSQSTSLNVYDVKIENKAATISGKDRVLCKKPGYGSSISLPSGFLSSPKFSSVSSTSTQDRMVSSSSYDSPSSASCSKVPPALAKRKAESRLSKLCTSASTSERLLKKSKELEHNTFLTLSASISGNSSDASSSRPASRSKQQSYDLEAYCDTSGSLRRRGLQNSVIQGQSMSNTSHRKSSLSVQYEEIKSPAQLNTQVQIGASPITAESRKKLKPSCLRQPSPKIGFFDEEKMTAETARGGLQFQFEIESTPPFKYWSTIEKTPDELLAAKTSPETSSEHNSRRSHLCCHAPAIKHRKASSDEKLRSSSPKMSSTMKNWSDGALRLHTHKCGQTKGEICSKSRKVGAGKCDRRRVVENSCFTRNDQGRVKERLKKRLGGDRKGQKDDINIQRELVNPSEKERGACQQNIMDMHLLNEDKTRTLTSFEDQLSDLSRRFEFIDLRRDMLVELKGKKDYPYTQSGGNNIRNHVETTTSCLDGRSILDDQQQDPSNLLSLSTTDNLPSSRTPLADKTSMWNRSSSFDLSLESAKAMLVPKALALSSFPGTGKENS